MVNSITCRVFVSFFCFFSGEILMEIDYRHFFFFFWGGGGSGCLYVRDGARV